MVDKGYVFIGIGAMTVIAALVLIKITRLGLPIAVTLIGFGLLCCCCGAVESIFFTNVTQQQADEVRKQKKREETINSLNEIVSKVE